MYYELRKRGTSPCREVGNVVPIRSCGPGTQKRAGLRRPSSIWGLNVRLLLGLVRFGSGGLGG